MCATCVCAIIEPKPEMEKPSEMDQKMESTEMESDSTGTKVKRFLSNHGIHHTTPCPPWQQQKIWKPEIKQLQHYVHQPIYKTHEVPKHTVTLFKPQHHHHGWQHQQQFGFLKPQYESYQHSAWIPNHKPQIEWNSNSLWQPQIHKPMYHVQKVGWQAPQLWQQPKIQVVSTPKPFYHHIPSYHKPMYHQQQHFGNHYNNLLIKTAVTTDCPPLFQHHQQLFKSPGVVYAPEHQIKYVHEEPDVQLLKIHKPTIHHSAPTYLPPLQHHSVKIPQYLGLDDCD